MSNDIVEVPPFPPLKWYSGSWEGEITLPTWACFQWRETYDASRRKKLPAGVAGITVESPDRKRRLPPSAEQSAAVRHLFENEAAVTQSVAQGLFEKYPEERAAYLDAYDIEESEDVPVISDVAGLRPLMQLNSVRVLDVFREGVAYVGFEFRCVWESEHGAGVMTHNGRIVSIGRATAAIDFWAAKKDADSKSGS